MDEPFSLFSYSGSLPSPVATCDVAAPPGGHVRATRCPLPPTSSEGWLSTGPRLASLAPGTDLNEPPLSTVGVWRPYELFPTSPQTGGSSAPHFIGAAERLKQLFALPFSTAPVSLAVHRLGDTLLVDSDEAVQRMLGACPSPPPPPPRHIGSDSGHAKQRGGSKAPRSEATAKRNASKLLEAKLFYHALSVEASLAALEAADAPPSPSSSSVAESQAAASLVLWAEGGGSPHHRGADPSSDSEGDGALRLRGAARQVALAAVRPPQVAPPATPEPASTETRWAPPRSSHGTTPAGTFDLTPRLFEWQLDAHMRVVVESPLVLFRSPTRQPISLKLLSVDERVTALMCLSAWLDNVMTSVPELAVCWHRAGVVRGFETVRTEDVPELCDPPFDPMEVIAAGRHVLSFLQQSCSRDGATYWLRRDEASGALQLFDVGAFKRDDGPLGPPHSGGDDHPAGQGGMTPAPVSSHAMGHLCQRLAMQLQTDSPGATQDRWRLLHRACVLMDSRTHARELATALSHYAWACLLHADVEADLMKVQREAESAATHPRGATLPLPGPMQQPSDAALAGMALPPLSVAPLAPWCPSQATHTGLHQALLALHRGASLLGGDDTSVEERWGACAVAAELSRRAYASRSVGAALAWAQCAVCTAPTAPAALALLGDMHATLAQAAAGEGAGHADGWHATTALCPGGGASMASSASVAADVRASCTAGPSSDAGAHRSAAAAAYRAALDVPTEPRRDAGAGSNPPDVFGHARAWLALNGGSPAEAIRRTVQRRLASTLNDIGQAHLAAASQCGEHTARWESLAGADGAFTEARQLFRAAGDAVNEALVLRNAAYAVRQRTLSNAAAPGTRQLLDEYGRCADLCRAASKVLKRREVAPSVWDLVHAELGRSLLAEGLYRALHDPDAASSGSKAAGALADAVHVLSTCSLAGITGDVAAAHFHLASLLAKSCVSATGAHPSSEKAKSAVRHFERAAELLGPQQGTCLSPVDVVRIRLRLCELCHSFAAHERTRAGFWYGEAVQHLARSAAACASLPHGTDTAALETQVDEALMTSLREAVRCSSHNEARHRTAYAAALRSKAGQEALAARLAALLAT
jgi:hypothetical protein